MPTSTSRCRSYRTVLASWGKERVRCGFWQGHKGDHRKHAGWALFEWGPTHIHEFRRPESMPKPAVGEEMQDREEIIQIIGRRSKWDLGERIHGMIQVLRERNKERDAATDKIERLEKEAEASRRETERLVGDVRLARGQRDQLMDAVENHEEAENDFFHHRRRAEGTRGTMLDVFSDVGHRRQLDREPGDEGRNFMGFTPDPKETFGWRRTDTGRTDCLGPSCGTKPPKR